MQLPTKLHIFHILAPLCTYNSYCHVKKLGIRTSDWQKELRQETSNSPPPPYSPFCVLPEFSKLLPQHFQLSLLKIFFFWRLELLVVFLACHTTMCTIFHFFFFSQQQSCVYDLTSADVHLQIGHTTAEKSKSIMWVQMTVAVLLLEASIHWLPPQKVFRRKWLGFQNHQIFLQVLTSRVASSLFKAVRDLFPLSLLPPNFFHHVYLQSFIWLKKLTNLYNDHFSRLCQSIFFEFIFVQSIFAIVNCGLTILTF